MRNARSCAAVMAMGSWKQPDERCYIEQPWAPSAGRERVLEVVGRLQPSGSDAEREAIAAAVMA